ncbi:MAG: hypothetical protein A2W08_16315 [Candidatus Rokubacteria bacterium RBG_16_73_20]|nr:MAG: hypothetical protein A2050_09260 [Candidatus Rokubacteria bacterium GWA2_73_35]OGK95494.1 MAG: hypothetical protein A2W08_16315 [Candidatus Rokubacteria bacterium RBG_16_73_20]HBH00335.1 hypothetical protein [Candidatus Rokubacteria bacterium]
MITFPVERKSAAPGGDSTVPDRTVVYRRALLIRVPDFMLEDVLDAVIAKAALMDKDRIPWRTVKEQLDL